MTYFLGMERVFGSDGDEGYYLRVDEYGTTLRLDHLRRERGELIGELVLECVPRTVDLPHEDGIVHAAAFNVSSAAARRDRAKFLATRTGNDCWSSPLEILCIRTMAAERAGRPGIRLQDIERPAPDAHLAPVGLALPRTMPAIVFGDGGSGKTYLSQRVVLELARSGLRIGWFDWEFDGGEVAERFDLLAPGEEPDVIYVRCERPLVHEADRLRQIIRDERLDYAVLDSVAFACDGPAAADEVASAYFRALRRLRIGTLNIAHNTKAGDEEKPFGSVFWHNGARASWFVKRTSEAMDRTRLSLAVFNRKWNMGGLLPAVGFDVAFLDDRTTFDRVDVATIPEFADRLPVWQRVVTIVRTEGALTLVDLAKRLDVPVDTVTKAVSRGEGKVFVRFPGEDGIYRVGLAARQAA